MTRSDDRLEPDQVLAWADEWVYVPDGAPTVETEEYLLVGQPLTSPDPTGVFRIRSPRPAAELVDDVLAATVGIGRDAVTFWTHAGTRPSGLVEELTSRGAHLLEELAVLARRTNGVLPDLDVPADVEIRAVTDLPTLRDADLVGVAVFGGTPSDDDALRTLLERRDPAASGRHVAYLDGRPVGTAGVAYAGEVARLWGGSVVGDARGRGVYRALLDRRLADARDRGCRAALVKGRLTTSAPTLRRAGFVEHGEERGYRLDGEAVTRS